MDSWPDRGAIRNAQMSKPQRSMPDSSASFGLESAGGMKAPRALAAMLTLHHVGKKVVQLIIVCERVVGRGVEYEVKGNGVLEKNS